MKITFNNISTISHKSHQLNIKNKPCCASHKTIYNLPNYQQINPNLLTFTGNPNRTPLDNYIGGYKKEKTLIDNILLKPIEDKSGIPSSLLLAFPDDYTKTQVLEGIKNTANANFINIPSTNKNICEIVKYELQKAAEQYPKNKQATVLIIDNAENIIGMTRGYAKEYSLIQLEDDDLKTLKLSNNDLKKINYFKSQLDNIGKTSSYNPANKTPITILFVTQKPQYIHPDILTRDGKMKKIIFPHSSGNNAKGVIKFELKNTQKALTQLITGTGITELQQDTQTKALKNNTKNNLRIDVENIPFQIITKHFAPNKRNGAYSNNTYCELTMKSLKDYINQPQTPYSIHFTYNLAKSKRDIPAQQTIQYESIRKLLCCI